MKDENKYEIDLSDRSFERMADVINSEQLRTSK